MVTTKMVKFRFKAPRAKNVYLAGDFTDWEKGAVVMIPGKRTGEWVCQRNLTEGEHQYKFIVDGQWYIDPNASSQTWNNFGSQNSIINI